MAFANTTSSRSVRAEAMKLAQEIAECSPLGLVSTRATMRAGLADRVLAATTVELVDRPLRAIEDFKKASKPPPNVLRREFQGTVSGAPSISRPGLWPGSYARLSEDGGDGFFPRRVVVMGPLRSRGTTCC